MHEGERLIFSNSRCASDNLQEPPSKLAKTACEKDVKSEDKPEESKTVAVPEKPENKEAVEGEAMEVDAVETVPTKG